MWEIPFYLIFAPLLTILVTLISSLKYKKYILGPIALLVILNIPTIILPLNYNVGWVAPLGWAFFYTIISALISLIVWLKRRKSTLAHIA